jgi:hypothetical protein
MHGLAARRTAPAPLRTGRSPHARILAAPLPAPKVTRNQLKALQDLHTHPTTFERLRVKGDGACMFRSVAQGAALLKTGSLLGGEQEWAAAQRLRADVVEHLRASRE